MVLWLACGRAQAGAPPQQARLKWGELGPAVAGKNVAFILPDGTHVRGKAIAVEPDGLRMKVTHTSNRQSQPKGRHVVPRQAISLLQVTDYRKLGRLLGTAGAVAAAAGIVAAHDIDIYEGPLVVIVPVVAVAGTAGAGVGGYYLGKAFDKRVAEIRIVPDGSLTSSPGSSAQR
jgi:hypothetical protein